MSADDLVTVYEKFENGVRTVELEDGTVLREESMKPLNPFKRVFDQFQRVAIAGAPKVGKTTLSNMVTDRPILRTDDHRQGDWSKNSEGVMITVNSTPGPLVIEGVRVPHALRKGMKVDAVIYLTQPKAEQTSKQISMGKACRTVFNEWRFAHPDVPVFAEPLEQYSPFEEEPEADGAA